ncbi:DNA translocase FtsK 4TM domain-containing protein [Desulfococcaceae bacterium OttesenSCG-928-F15]|nr:DNA translocase FtsK 4TM domain-containing protein [Desulfococcaceae bacterium OttesenSCG-928-F15]
MRRELAALFLFFLALFLLGSLLSYQAEDPLSLGAAGGVKNIFGLVGAWIAYFFLAVFGLGALWLPIFVFDVSRRLYFKKESHSFSAFFRAFGCILLILCTAALAVDMGPKSGPFALSGSLGLYLRDLLVLYLHAGGAIFCLFFFLFFGLVLTTGIAASRFFSFFSQCAALLKRLILFCFFVFLRLMKKFIALCSKLFSRRKKEKKGKKEEEDFLFLPEPRIFTLENEVAPEAESHGETQSAKNSWPLIRPPAAPSVQQELFKPKFDVQGHFEGTYVLPNPDLLDPVLESTSKIDTAFLQEQSEILQKKLADFGVTGRVTTVNPGPVITTFEYKPAPGVKISKVTNLADDLALALRALSIRIVAPIPGKAAIGIEVPNSHREMVHFREIVTSEAFTKRTSPLTVCLGKDIVGNPVAAELDRMPHLLIAGATGAGKSVGLNVMIVSLLFKSTPDQVKLIMIDPKRIELSVYDGIPHLITPVVTDMKKATAALFWAVKEMEHRYELLAALKCRNITQYNEKIEELLKEAENSGKDADFADKTEDSSGDHEEEIPLEKLPYIVIIIDELADLMMVASKDVEVALARLAQMARASGIHIVLATQRPSVDVLTGLIKANFPTRLAFQVSSRIDSRTILDANGAEALLGNGDMLFVPPGTAKIQRIHGAYLGEGELSRIISFVKAQGEPEYLGSVTETPIGLGNPEAGGEGEGEELDPRYDEAVALVMKAGQASISMVQRHLRIGYNRAARIIEAMEQNGVIGPSDGTSKPREVLSSHHGIP